MFRFMTHTPVICLLVFAATLVVEADQGRAVGVRAAGSVASLPDASKRWALIVGVDQYEDEQIGRLTGAQNDAKELRDALIRYAGFPPDQVILLTTEESADRRPTRLNLYKRLSNLSSIMPKDGLFLFAFSGHGVERKGRAFLLPADAQMSDDVDFLEQTAVSVDWVKEKIKGSGVAQVLVMLDACRNDPGGRADAPNKMTEAYTRGFDFGAQNKEISAFAVLYATAVGQRAYEFAEKRQGYFSWSVVEALRGSAADEQGNITLTRLIRYVQDNVPKRVAIDHGSGREQRPFAVVEGYRADELVLAKASIPKGPAREDVAELSFWDSIKGETDPAFFREYLARYPTGRFASIAALKVNRTTTATTYTPSSPTPAPTASPAAPGITVSTGSDRIAVVDVQKVLTKSAEGKAAYARLKKMQEDRMARAKELDEEVRKLDAEIAVKKLSLSEEKLAELNKRLADKRLAMQRFAQDADREIGEERDRELAKLDKAILPIVDRLGKGLGATAILNKFESGLVYANDALDVTNLVLAAWESGTMPAKPLAFQGWMAVVDVQKVLKESLEGKASYARLKRMQDDRLARAEELNDELERLKTSGASERSIEVKKIEVARYKEDSDREITEARDRELQSLQVKVMPIVDSIGKELGLSFIFNKFESGLVFASDVTDITDDLVARFDDPSHRVRKRGQVPARIAMIDVSKVSASESKTKEAIDLLGHEMGLALVFNKYKSGLIYATDAIDITQSLQKRVASR